MRRFFSRLFVPVLLSAILGGHPAFAQNIPASEQTPKPAVHVTLLQLNDVYQISSVDKGQRGGLARIATLEKRISAQNPNTLLILGGDTISPSIASQIFQGRHIIDIWNQVGLDIAVLGNHEFDFGNEILLQRMQESHFTWVNANVIDTTTGKPFGNSTASIIKEIEGVKIGFFGLLTPDTANASHPGPNVLFKDPILTACETVNQLRKDGADVLVAVTHLPMNQDKLMVGKLPLRLAAVMGGHDHTLLQAAAGGIPIFKVGSDARNLGRIDLWINPETRKLESVDWEIIPVTAEVPEDPAIAASVNTYEEQLNAELGQVIGETTVELDARQETNRSRETNLGNFIADTYRARLGTDVALLNGGSIRSNTTYGPGSLTRRDALSILPFGNPVVKVQVSGRQLLEALENGVRRPADEEAGRFPQISGMRFVYDPTRPPGSRVISVTINGRPLNPGKLYTLAATSYLVAGGDDYLMFKGAKTLVAPEEAPLEVDILQDAITQAKVISPKVDGRIQKLAPANKI